MIALLRLVLRPAPVAPEAEALRLTWEHLYDTEQGSDREKAAWQAYQLASVDLERAA